MIFWFFSGYAGEQETVLLSDGDGSKNMDYT